jgi:phosphohistidine phosphatase
MGVFAMKKPTLVCFLRHAEAEDTAADDFSRRLTSKGLEQADRAGRFCAQAGLVPGVVLSSPVLRALQTAEIVAGRLGGLPVRVERWLACGMGPEAFFGGLAPIEAGTVFVVGHEPDFSTTIAALTGMADADRIHVRKASLTGVDVFSLSRGGGTLEFLVPARLM